MVVTSKAFAELKGVSPAAVSLAVKRGALDLLPEGGIETDSPKAHAYSPRAKNSGQAAAPRKVSKEKPKRSAGETSSPPDDSDIDDSDLDDTDAIPPHLLSTEDLRARVRHRRALTRLAELRELTVKRTLVEFSELEALVRAINQAMQVHIHQQHAKSGPQVFALARRDGGTEIEVTRRLEADYGAALRRCVEDVLRALPVGE